MTDLGGGVVRVEAEAGDDEGDPSRSSVGESFDGLEGARALRAPRLELAGSVAEVEAKPLASAGLLGLLGLLGTDCIKLVARVLAPPL